MKLFFDMEFTGLHKNTTPISLGIVSEDGKKFCAEFLDFDVKQCGEWVKENGISHLRLPKLLGRNTILETWREKERWKKNGYLVADICLISDGWLRCVYPTCRINGDVKEVVGDRPWVNACLQDWIQQFDSVQFVSDVCHYDFVLLIDILTNGGTALDLPENISPACIDLNQEIMRHFQISSREAFDMSREQIVHDLCGEDGVVFGDKHNSLYDAEVIHAICKEIYER